MTNEQWKTLIDWESKRYAFRNGHPLMRDMVSMNRTDLCGVMYLAFEAGADTGLSLAEIAALTKGPE